MKLTGAVTQGSGAINEDGMGYLGQVDDVTAAWVFDGVTGINERNYLPGGTDAAWLVGKAHEHLLALAAPNIPLEEIVSKLVHALINDWSVVAKGIEFPENYDPPASCLILVKRYGNIWRAVRLGDSSLLARMQNGEHKILAASPNNAFDGWLNTEADKRRRAGQLDLKALMTEFQPQLMQARKGRNTSGSYGILEAELAAIKFAEYLDIGSPTDLLICTDGYYRAVDYYSLYDDSKLIAASMGPNGVDRVLARLRAAETSDSSCQRYPRLKPADDATAVMLRQRD